MFLWQTIWKRKVTNPDRANRAVSPDSRDRASRAVSPAKTNRKRAVRTRTRKRIRTATVSVALPSFLFDAMIGVPALCRDFIFGGRSLCAWKEQNDIQETACKKRTVLEHRSPHTGPSGAKLYQRVPRAKREP